MVGRGSQGPEAVTRKPNPVTIESESEGESDAEAEKEKNENPKKRKQPPGVRFKEPVVEAPKKKLPERPFVMVPPLKTKPLAPFVPLPEAGKTQTPASEALPTLGKTPSYNNRAPIEDDEALRRIIEELINTKFTTSLKDLASVSTPAREYLKKLITRRKVAKGDVKASDLEYQIISLMDLWTQQQEERIVQLLNLLDEAEEVSEEEPDREEISEDAPRVFNTYVQMEDLPRAEIYCAKDLTGVPDGAFVISDPVEQYLNSLAEGEEPRPILVARESVALRTVFPAINKAGRAEVLLDTGSQICSMDSDVARNLGLAWDPDIVIHLQSANRTVEKTLGLARNVEFDFGGVIAYIQLHIIRRPAYHVLLGRPFDVAMSSEVVNSVNGDPDSEPWDHSYEDHDGLRGYSKPNEEDPDPLDFEEFKKEIDTRGGYVQKQVLAITALDLFEQELQKEVFFENQLQEVLGPVQKQFVNVEVLPDNKLKEDPETVEEYDESRRAKWARKLDERLPKIRKWLQGPLNRPEGMEPKDVGKWVRECSHFFEKDGKLYRRQSGFPQLVVEKEHRMYMLRASHDSLGHRGPWATTQFLAKRFWWPDLEGDVAWYCRTCHICQLRTKMLLKIPPRVTETPSIFQVLHADVMNMTPASNGCKYIVHGRCALTSWAEGKPLREDSGPAIGAWLLDIITRWGCMKEIVTDNGGSFVKATAWLEKKYGIKGIKISPYNSKANGRIERPHYDIRDMLFKATGGKTSQWFWYFPHILWADRITARRRFGVSPFFILTGAEPVVPLDIQEATWLVEPPSGPLTTEELIAQRAKALAKHRDLVEDMRQRVDKEKRERVAKYEEEYKAVIKDFRFKRGDLVLLRNTSIEKSLDKKMKPRYLGPLVVVTRNKGGAYILAEMDGTVLQSAAAAFRVIPYHARKRIELPPNIHEFIDISSRTLREMRELKDDGEVEDLAFRGMPDSFRSDED